jgi:hypothetical protein
MYLYPNSNILEISNPSHPVFLEVEREFWAWLESSNPANQYEEMYFSDDAIYTKRGAIIGAIEELLNEAQETNKPVLIKTFDFDAVFS